VVEKESRAAKQGEKQNEGKNPPCALLPLPYLETVIGFAALLSRRPRWRWGGDDGWWTGDNELPLAQRAIHLETGPRLLDLKLLLAMRTGGKHGESVEREKLSGCQLVKKIAPPSRGILFTRR
jgi:hypothetical protein